MWNYWRIDETFFIIRLFIQCINNEKYKEFIDEYKEELINIHKSNIATIARKINGEI